MLFEQYHLLCKYQNSEKGTPSYMRRFLLYRAFKIEMNRYKQHKVSLNRLFFSKLCPKRIMVNIIKYTQLNGRKLCLQIYLQICIGSLLKYNQTLQCYTGVKCNYYVHTTLAKVSLFKINITILKRLQLFYVLCVHRD